MFVCWHLDLLVSRVGLWGNSCYCWMRLVLADKAQDRERAYTCDQALKCLPTLNLLKSWQHSGHVFVCKGCGNKFNPKNIISKQDDCVWHASPQEELFPLLHAGKHQHWWDHLQSKQEGGVETDQLTMEAWWMSTSCDVEHLSENKIWTERDWFFKEHELSK